MNTLRIVTVKPEERILEYEIRNPAGDIIRHGDQVVYADETSLAQWQALCEADATAKGLL